jgi:ectoine hydroxylase-related dioxygenase (phytanoyl-CoA dioxygenase family)
MIAYKRILSKGTLVKCDAGDLILWDSRLIHGGLIREPSEDFKKTSNKNELVRFAMTVSMTPKSLASDWVL